MNPVGLTVDVDSVASHLAGYGFPYRGDASDAYRTAIPRVLDLFGRLEVRGTFFLIADEAKSYPEVVGRIVAEGHEVASHSLTHALPFPRIAGAALDREVADSKALLESLCECRVVGFRAPSWEFSRALLESLARAGYGYDASAYPSPLLFALRRSVAKRSDTQAERRLGATWRECFSSPKLRAYQTESGPIAGIPLCTTPGLRLPYYHTLRFLLPHIAQQSIGAWARTRRSGVSYCFHAVDFLGLEQDGLDRRIARHPGMSLPLNRKLEMATQAIHALRRGRRVVPLAELVGAPHGDDTVAKPPLQAGSTG